MALAQPFDMNLWLFAHSFSLSVTMCMCYTYACRQKQFSYNTYIVKMHQAKRQPSSSIVRSFILVLNSLRANGTNGFNPCSSFFFVSVHLSHFRTGCGELHNNYKNAKNTPNIIRLNGGNCCHFCAHSSFVMPL